MVDVAIIMGSASDWNIMQESAIILDNFKVEYEVQVVSAHRTPEFMFKFATDARARNIKVIIAGAGGAAHLPGMVAALTTLPVLGVPIPIKYLEGQDSLLSIVQMPKGVPVATFAIGQAGATNAALFAVAILASANPKLQNALDDFRNSQTQKVLDTKISWESQVK